MGWIRIDRGIQDNFLWNDGEPMSRGQAWIDLLLRANFTDGKILLGGKPTIIKRGQLHTSIVNLALYWRWSRNRVTRFLDLLEKDQMITTERTAYGTTITLVNYELYQSDDATDGAPNETPDGATDGATGGAPDGATDGAQYKKEKKEKKEKNLKREKDISGPFFPNDELLDEAFTKYIQYRKEAKIKTTDEAIRLEMKNLQKYSEGDNDKAIAIIEQTISRGWRGLFPLKEDKKPQNGSIDWSKV